MTSIPLRSRSRPRVLWLDPGDFLGGAEFFSLDILPLLARDFHITVLTNSLRSTFGETLMKSGITVRENNFPRLKPITPFSLFRFLQSVHSIKKILKKEEYEIIHTNSIRTHLIGSRAIPVVKKKYPKCTWFVHDFTFPGWAVKRIGSVPSKIFSCSQAVKEDFMKKGISEKLVEVVPNGVDGARFLHFPRRKFMQDSPSIGMLGRIDIWKGQDVFLKSAGIVIRKFPKAKFLIFGESSPYDKKTVDFENSLKKYVEDHGLAHNVEFRGFVDPEKAFPEMDVFVHASTSPEPFGRVIIEALAAGVPVIATREGGPSEIIHDGLQGSLVPACDPDILGERILDLITSEDLRDTYSGNGRKLISQKFSLSLVTEKITDSWMKLM